MSPAQRRLLALLGILLSGLVCLGFLPVSQLVAAFILFAVWGVIAIVWFATCSRTEHDASISLDNLPEATYRHPVVLVCGDLPQVWSEPSQVLIATQGCWIRVEDHQDVALIARQVLWQRPDWGHQLSVMVSVCPQKHTDSESLTRRLQVRRWQINQLRRDTGYSIPLVLNGQVGCAMMSDMLWQAVMPGKGISVWHDTSAPCSVPARVTVGGAQAMQQQVLMNSLMAWLYKHVKAVFMDDKPDIPPIEPTVVLWGMGPILAGSLTSSVWTAWLTRHTAMKPVAGWHPVGTETIVMPMFPDFVLPLLPEGQGLTPYQRTFHCALNLFTLAAIATLLSVGWNNRQLLRNLSFDIQHYYRIAMGDHGPKAQAINVLRQNAAQLDHWARSGEPLRVGLGLYQGERLRMPVLDAIHTYVAPLNLPKQVPTIIRLDSLSLFDPGKAELNTGSTKALVNSLVDIKARTGWLIVVSGHTDNTGNPLLNQALSLKRAESVRNWMRDTGDVPESCFAVQGHGESQPIASNDTPEGRVLNRRVEIRLVPQADACRTAGNPLPSTENDDGIQREMEK